ncbi:MAG: 1-(5-phosphoribosyl)-5-[(5-phosphoribosylamino)methylideneamino]imidazole-4-carboxamide isomerase, partial [Candidatus Omnitrophica bacterium]|nr:1-(5-phosphoribosyl)-5-[(5-phosphoribosylamino)methylideneamino]imidazole-4-carboxamide isomerase [Candidatus Omnitrophota bacterium]
MIIFPAIDIKDGKVVRLLQGRFDDVTEYSKEPLGVAKQWVDQGAQWLHVVDLDGAKTGRLVNVDAISEIAQRISIPIEVGGGIRTITDIIRLIEAGVKRVILGTKAVEDRGFFKEVLKEWPDQIAVSLDCRDGKVAQRGWTEVTEVNAIDFATELEKLGLRCLIFTDIKTDGMLRGPNIPALKELLDHVNIPLIASGGVSKLDDIYRLKELEANGVMGVITGKAIYEGTL